MVGTAGGRAAMVIYAIGAVTLSSRATTLAINQVTSTAAIAFFRAITGIISSLFNSRTGAL